MTGEPDGSAPRLPVAGAGPGSTRPTGATARRPGFVAAVVVAAVAVTAALAFVALSAGGSGGSEDGPTSQVSSALKPADPDRPVATPARQTGPQGRVGQFVVGCTYSHSATDDPIVHFGEPGRSHRHDFYGSVETDADTPAEDLLDTETTCDKSVDTAAYWQPTLYDHDEVVEPVEVHAYYRAAPGIDPQTVQTMPTGLALIAGDMTSTVPQDGEATGWTCGSNTDIADDPPECEPSAPLHLVLTFQDCWDGTYLDSEDHQSHVAYSTDGRCPDGYEVSIPQITMTVKYPISGPGHDLRLASGNIYSAHGDFFNAWEPDGLAREVNACIRRDVVCDLASNRAEEPLFAGP